MESSHIDVESAKELTTIIRDNRIKLKIEKEIAMATAAFKIVKLISKTDKMKIEEQPTLKKKGYVAVARTRKPYKKPEAV